MAFVDRSDSGKPRGVETYRTPTGRIMVEPPRGSALKKGEVRKAVQTLRSARSEVLAKPSR